MKFDTLLSLTTTCNENDLVSWMVQLFVPKFIKRLNAKLTEVNINPPNDSSLRCPLETKEQCSVRALLLQAFFPPDTSQEKLLASAFMEWKACSTSPSNKYCCTSQPGQVTKPKRNLLHVCNEHQVTVVCALKILTTWDKKKIFYFTFTSEQLFLCLNVIYKLVSHQWQPIH